MLDSVFKVLFLTMWIAASVIRVSYERRYRQNRVSELRSRDVAPLEKTFLLFTFVGMVVIPFLHLLTPWLDFADYHLPTWAGSLGIGFFLVALWLLWSSHADLGRNWFATLTIGKDHSLVTSGVYQSIRHPMYAAHLLWGIAQSFLLQNWIASPSLLVSLIPLYALRIPREEKMMLEHFGDDYRSYMNRTGRFIPPLWKSLQERRSLA